MRIKIENFIEGSPKSVKKLRPWQNFSTFHHFVSVWRSFQLCNIKASSIYNNTGSMYFCIMYNAKEDPE